MKKMRKLTGLLLSCIVLTILITGCSSTSNGSDGDPDGTVQEEGSAGNESKSDEVTELSLFMNETWFYYNTFEGRIPEKITEKTNVKFDVTVAADDTALSMLIASGDLGDLVCTGIGSDFDRLLDSNLCYTYDELCQEYYGEDFDVNEVVRFVNQTDDGDLFTIRVGWSEQEVWDQYPSAINDSSGIVVRSDIYEELGNPEIKSLDDLEAVLAQVKQDYPDVVPVVFNGSYNGRFLRECLGATDVSGFYDNDGNAELFIYDKGLWNYLSLLNDWYLKGYITPESMSFVDQEEVEWFINGKAFCDIAFDQAEILQGAYLTQADCDYNFIQLTDFDFTGTNAKVTISDVGWRGLFIPKSCKNPKAAIDFVRWANSKEGQELMLWGEEGVDWDWNEDKTIPILAGDYLEHYSDIPYLQENGQLRLWGFMTHNGVQNGLPETAEQNNPTYKARMMMRPITELNPILGMISFSPDSDEVVTITKIQNLYDTDEAKIIFASSQEEARAFYEEMIQAADEMGGQTINEKANQQYFEKAEQYRELNER